MCFLNQETFKFTDVDPAEFVLVNRQLLLPFGVNCVGEQFYNIVRVHEVGVPDLRVSVVPCPAVFRERKPEPQTGDGKR